VLEIDPELVELARRRLGLRESPGLEVVVGDARVKLRDQPARSADVVVGDAFGGRSVPWHLATREFFADVRRVLRADGVYAMNLIDHGPLDLARAEAATLRGVFGHVALIAEPGPSGGNLVLVASRRPLPRLRVPRGARLYDERATARFAAGAEPLTDDHAPADQLLTTSG
jgi:spermidine synthase